MGTLSACVRKVVGTKHGSVSANCAAVSPFTLYTIPRTSTAWFFFRQSAVSQYFIGKWNSVAICTVAGALASCTSTTYVKSVARSSPPLPTDGGSVIKCKRPEDQNAEVCIDTLMASRAAEFVNVRI